MSKVYTIKDLQNLKKLSTLAAMYKGKKKVGVTVAYIRQLKDEGKFEIIEIDGVQFVDIASLPEEIRKNLKK